MRSSPRPGVRVGIADPRFDASGYRAMMVFFLAQAEYDQPRLFERDVPGTSSATRSPSSRMMTWPTSPCPRSWRPVSGARIVIRGASIQLIALLQSGDLDYAFEYESSSSSTA